MLDPLKYLRKLPKGGIGYFTPAQVGELQSMLGLDNYETASRAAQKITRVLARCELDVDARKIVGCDSEAKDRLLKIALHAKELARLLCQDPYGDDVIPPPKSHREGGGMTFDKLEEATRRPKEFLEDLRILAEQATRQATDASEFARVRWLFRNLNTKNPEVQIVTQFLWPELFEGWVSVGKKLAWTNNGPTHRYIALVHDAAGLPPPKHSTLRDAIRKWKKEQGEPSQPPARHGGS